MESGETVTTSAALPKLAEDPYQSPRDQQEAQVKGIWALFLGSLSLIPLSMVLGWFDNTTELIPAHENVDQACFALAALCGLLACGAAIYLTRKLSIIQRIMLPLVFVFETAIGIFLVANHCSSIVEGWVDFPAAKTQTGQVLFPISRAYKTHGKGTSQYAQTAPIWSNLKITREDFDFMQNHRRPGDDGHSPDEIQSQGYFCANVTIEQSDKALRILHAGSKELLKGAVIVCPAPTSAR